MLKRKVGDEFSTGDTVASGACGWADDTDAGPPEPSRRTDRRDPGTADTLASGEASAGGRSDEGELSQGATVGRFTVLRRLGAGGMGVVYAAYDPELDRKVALKLVRAAGGGAAQVRLYREAQALAKLTHPNVVTIHDVGTREGQVWLAMEFVVGEQLDAWRVRVKPGWKDVLSVMSEAGRGVAAAHRAGLLHRDIKPDNIMIGADGRTRVMDFGLARVDAGDEAASAARDPRGALSIELTTVGAIMGTPAYMAPEQFAGQTADASTDQFSLCATLWELLHGERAFAGDTFAALATAVTRGERRPPPPGSRVPGWLRAVVERGLATRREDRHSSVDALLAALADDPAPRRRRRTAAGITLVLAIGGALAIENRLGEDAQFCRHAAEKLAGTWDDEARAQVEQAMLGTGTSYAPDAWQRVQERLDAYAAEWVNGRQDACEATRHGEQSGALLDLRMACLDQHKLHLRATVDELRRADEEVVQGAVETVRMLPAVGRCADIEALLADVAAPEDPELAARVAELDARLVEADVKEKFGKYDEGLALVDAVVAQGEVLGYEPLMARAWLAQGWLQERKASYPASAVTLGRSLDAALATGSTALAADAATYLMLVVGVRQARHAEGQRWGELADPLTRAVGTEESRALWLHNRGLIASSEGRYGAARDDITRALALAEAAPDANPLFVAGLLNSAGSVAFHDGELVEAREDFERSRSLLTAALGPDHPRVTSAVGNLGAVLKAEGKYDEARAQFEWVLAAKERALGSDHPDVANALGMLGDTALAEGKNADARGYYERALAIHERTASPGRVVIATHQGLGDAAHAEGEYAVARGHYERALAIGVETLGAEHPELSSVRMNMGIMANAEGRYEDARKILEQSLAIDEKALEPNNPELAFHLTALGEALLGLERPALARPHLERALSLRTGREIDPSLLAQTRFALARALWDAATNDQDRVRARTLAEAARDGYREHADRSVEDLAAIEAWLPAHRRR